MIPRSLKTRTHMRRSARLLTASSSIKNELSDATSCTVLPAVVPAPLSPSNSHVKAEQTKADDWASLCSTRELSCSLTLESGQVFSWRRHPTELASWLGVIKRRVFALRERHNMVEFQCLYPSNVSYQEGFEALSYYFRLDMPADPLYERWTETADRMSERIKRLRGLRIVRQDPVECLFSFICSSNNNIGRIQGMVENLKATYGDWLYTADFQLTNKTERSFYAFPSVKTLARACNEETLRALGFGYRAAFLVKTAHQLEERGGALYLDHIRNGKTGASSCPNKEEATFNQAYQDDLMVFAGVGRKVADCVALFSLEKLDAIPVDTHVWQIACREFDPTLRDRKSITPRVYRWVGDLFRTRFAPHAGWAHSVLFAGDVLVSRDAKKMKSKQVSFKRKFRQEEQVANNS